ncbi:MAG: aldo/keto reductase [Chitinophagaceae bacterium]|nr:MAG: aldo/keto reductase [Chitinophagaceae bacterium]
MQKRTLGKSAIQVAPIAFGGNVFGWTLDEKKSFEILDAFVAAGFNFMDTADTYSRWVPGNQGGESETIIGKWIKQRNNRSRIILATKVGGDMGEGRNLSKKYILKQVEKSLHRLQTDYIDLYQSHHDDNITPVEETLEAYSQLIREGKVRVIGASNISHDRLIASMECADKSNLPAYQTLQPLYNLYEREKFETEYKSICEKYALGVLPYYSLASGFLSGKYRSEEDVSKSLRGKGIHKKYMNEKGFGMLDALDKVSKQYHTVPASVAIAWLLSKPLIIAPVVSATSRQQLEEIIKGAELQLDKEAVEILEKG